MSEVRGEIDGNLTLEEIDAAVDNIEAGGAEFLRSTVEPVNNTATNVVVLNRLPPGKRPKEFTLTRQGAAAPPNTTQIWSGVMLVAGTMTAVVAYRDN
jgi:hypothetical protein